MQTYIKLSNSNVESLTVLAEQLEKAFEHKLSIINGSDLSVDIIEQAKKLLCRAQEWKSEAFFVIVVGPVKSGKSTFVNLLAHEHVSPTHFLECTVRPSIISQKKKQEESSMITPFVTKGEPSMEHVDSIIDYIKELDFADLNNVKIDTPCLLNEENLDQRVAYRNGIDLGENGKVALTSITAAGGEFLRENIYLIDMPGFDGVQANLDKAFYEAIVYRADLVVFVQSSNSAINKISEDFCTMIQKRNGSVPIIFVHNYFDSAYWHTEIERQKVTDGHIKKALDFFEEQKLIVKPENVYCINLGKVTDARNTAFLADSSKCISEYTDMLKLEESRFEEMERNLHKKISASQSKMRLLNCINRTIREAEILLELLKSRKSVLLSQKREYDRINELFENLKSEIRPIQVASVFDFKDKHVDLISKLQDIQKRFCSNIDHDKKYNTDSTREKARELIHMYKVSTEAFVKEIFNPALIQMDIRLKYNTSFMSSIPAELKRYDSLFENIHLEEASIEIDFSSIDGVYDVNKQIEKWIVKTRKGEHVIECMTDIEHSLFGLTPKNPCGFIPQQFYTTFQTDVIEWIKVIIQNYRNSYIGKVEMVKENTLKDVISNLENHEIEMVQTDRLINSVENILESLNLKK